MANSYLAYQNPTTTDKKLDSESLVVGLNTVERERIQVAGTGATDIAPVDATRGLKVDLGANNGVHLRGTTATYRSAFSVVGAGSGDVVEIVGSATKTVYVVEIVIIKPTVQRTFQIIKRSTADSGGTAGTPALVSFDSTNAVATAVVKSYTADPTEGTPVGSIFKGQLTTTETLAEIYIDGSGQIPTLRGVAETLCINVDGATNFECIVKVVEV